MPLLNTVTTLSVEVYVLGIIFTQMESFLNTEASLFQANAYSNDIIYFWLFFTNLYFNT